MQIYTVQGHSICVDREHTGSFYMIFYMIENKMKKIIIGSINLYCGHLLPECGGWAPVIHQLREFHKVSLLIISAVTAADVWRVLITPGDT